MGCEESFITMKLIRYGYLVPSLNICVYKTSTETGLIEETTQMLKNAITSMDSKQTRECCYLNPTKI